MIKKVIKIVGMDGVRFRCQNTDGTEELFIATEDIEDDLVEAVMTRIVAVIVNRQIVQISQIPTDVSLKLYK